MLINDITGMTDEDLDKTQYGLMAAGMAPGGFVADLADAGISLSRGDLMNAMLGLGAAVPGIGMAVGAGRLAKGAGKAAKAKEKVRNLYHVTRTEDVPSIQKLGLQPFGGPKMSSNWTKAGDESRYGEGGEIFAFEDLNDAMGWADTMDWANHDAWGTGKISIVKMKRTGDWAVDTADPLSQLGAKGQWLKQFGRVKPGDIEDSIPITDAIRDRTIGRDPPNYKDLFSKEYSRRINRKESGKRNLKAFMKGSKAVDEGGRPLDLYHGTPTSGFTVFSKEKIGKTDEGFFGRGFYFTERPKPASDYSEVGGTDISPRGMYKAHLSLKNPLEIRTSQMAPSMRVRFARKMKELGYKGHINDADKVTEFLKRKGYDGVIIKQRPSAEYATAPDSIRQLVTYDEYVAFEPDQIKSATANVGAYGQRPPTAEEAKRLGFGSSGTIAKQKALEAQEAGDIRLSLLPAAVGGGALAAQSMTEDDFARSIR